MINLYFYRGRLYQMSRVKKNKKQPLRSRVPLVDQLMLRLHIFKQIIKGLALGKFVLHRFITYSMK